MIGNTPLLAIDFRYRGSNRVIHAKCEHLNLTGSIKDRMALHILRRACESCELQSGDRVMEATSGNTGISFAALSRALGHPATIFMPRRLMSIPPTTRLMWFSIPRTQNS